MKSPLLVVVLLTGLASVSLWFSGAMRSIAMGEVPPPILVQCPASRDTANVESTDDLWYCSKCRIYHKVSDTRVDAIETDVGNPSVETHPPTP